MHKLLRRTRILCPVRGLHVCFGLSLRPAAQDQEVPLRCANTVFHTRPVSQQHSSSDSQTSNRAVHGQEPGCQFSKELVSPSCRIPLTSPVAAIPARRAQHAVLAEKTPGVLYYIHGRVQVFKCERRKA